MVEKPLKALIFHAVLIPIRVINVDVFSVKHACYRTYHLLCSKGRDVEAGNLFLRNYVAPGEITLINVNHNLSVTYTVKIISVASKLIAGNSESYAKYFWNAISCKCGYG